ncbi:MAG: phosphatase PAP2 family protein [Gemmatimonadales bacterium]
MSWSAAGAVYFAPRLFHIGTGSGSCAPCDRSSIPGFDRWIVGAERPSWSAASTVGLLGLALGSWVDLAARDDGERSLLTSLEAAGWAVALAEAAKAAFQRERPVLYTADALQAAQQEGNRRSLPSGHTAAAFAVATSYWLVAGEDRRTAKAVALGTAVGVGVLRVVARRHFPSDVVAGAALGVGTAIVVHEIRF